MSLAHVEVVKNIKNVVVNKNGFTLIELMIVIAIIGILAMVTVPKMRDFVNSSKEGATKGALSNIRSGLAIYYSSISIYPILTTNSSPTDVTGEFISAMVPTYLKKMPVCFVREHASNSSYNVYTDSDDAITDNGNWGFNGAENDKQGSNQWGAFWVSCTHTDVKKTIWSNY